MLLRLIRALAAFGIFAADAEGKVSHTERSLTLRRDANPTLHHAALYWTTPGNWAAWEKLEHTVRTGEPAFEAVFGMANFDYLKTHPEEAFAFDRFMQHSPDDRHEAVAEAYDFSGARRIVDVGDGNGAFLSALLAKYREMRATLFDSDAVVAGAGAVLGPWAARCDVEAGDFFGSVPEGGDMYALSQILHDWNDACCLKILANCRAAMGPQSRLIVIERVLDDTTSRNNPMNHLSDMDMMVLFPGAKERTLEEYGRLFAASGFCEPRLIPTRSPFSIIETRPKG